MLDAALVSAASRSFKTVFNQALSTDPGAWEKFAMRVTSTSTAEDYAWLGSLPQVREWISDRSFDQMRAYTYQIRNKNWEAGVEVDRDEIEDEKLDMVRPRIRGLAEVAQQHYVDLIMGLLPLGFTALAYDGQFFFDTDHSDGGGAAQSNKVTGVLTAANLDAAITQFMMLTSDNGTPLNVGPTHLVVPPQLRATARDLVELDTLSAGGSNPLFKSVTLVVDPRLRAHPTKWYLLDLSREIKPLVLQIRRPFQFISFDDERVHENAFMRKKFRYSVDGRHNAGYGLWQLALGSTGTV